MQAGKTKATSEKSKKIIGRLAASFFVVVLMSSVSAYADVVPSDESQEPVSKKNVELPESSPSSPPLATDDPGTPGVHGYEINFIGTMDAYNDGRDVTGGIDANVGIGERLQLRIEKEIRDQLKNDTSDFHSTGATDVGIKYRFYDDQNLKMAVYPSFNFDDGTRTPGADPEGRSFFLPIIVSKTFGRVTGLINAGIEKNIDFSEKKSTFFSIAAGYALSETLRAMGEVTTKIEEEGRRNDIRIGLVKEIYPNETSRYEKGAFASIGHNIGPTEDGLSHTTVLVGFTFAKKAD